MVKENGFKLWPYIARMHPKNKNNIERQKYPQLWYVWSSVPRWKKDGSMTLRCRLLEGLCKLLTGHEISKTEWGYGGGYFVDRHCRWCDHLIKVPKDEEYIPQGLEESVTELGFFGN